MALNRMFGGSQRRPLAAVPASGAAAVSAPSAAGEPTGFGEPARSQGDQLPAAQRQLTAVVPTSGLSLAGCGLLISLLVSLAAAPDLARQLLGWEVLPDSELYGRSLQLVRNCLGLRSQATLAGWLTQIFLLFAAATALVVRGVQRHRRDLVRRRFRAWGWLAIGWIAAAGATAMPLGPAVAISLVTLTETPFGPSGLGWWLACGVGGLAVPVLWAVLRMRERLPTAVPLAVGLLAWAGSVGCLWFANSDARLPLLANAGWLAGSGLILLAMMAAVRSSLREIDGLCPPATARPRKRKSPKVRSPKATRPARVAEPPAEPAEPPTTDPSNAVAVSSSTEADPEAESASDDAEPNRRLSKAERRRLRKLARSGRAA